MTLNAMSSAILNDLFGGNLVPLSNQALISQDQIEDEVIEERATILKEWYLKNLINRHELNLSINCIEVDCKDQNKCPCGQQISPRPAQHFEIPLLLNSLGPGAISFVGSTDRQNRFDVYFTPSAIEYRKYKKRNSDKPFIYIDTTPNENNKCDGWIFNAPFVKYISITAIFKDPRQLEEYNCCNDIDYLELGTISNEIKKRIIAKKVQLYRAAPTPQSPPVV